MAEMSLKRMQEVIAAQGQDLCLGRHPAHGVACTRLRGHISSHQGKHRENSVTSANEIVRWEDEG